MKAFFFFLNLITAVSTRAAEQKQQQPAGPFDYS